jgi:hypothetical protein
MTLNYPSHSEPCIAEITKAAYLIFNCSELPEKENKHRISEM